MLTVQNCCLLNIPGKILPKQFRTMSFHNEIFHLLKPSDHKTTFPAENSSESKSRKINFAVLAPGNKAKPITFLRLQWYSCPFAFTPSVREQLQACDSSLSFVDLPMDGILCPRFLAPSWRAKLLPRHWDCRKKDFEALTPNVTLFSRQKGRVN